VNGDTRQILADGLALPGVDAGTDRDLRMPEALNQRLPAADRPGRPVKASEEAIAGGGDLASAKALQQLANQAIVLLQRRRSGGLGGSLGLAA
jgi:hypothetical protein